MAGGVEINRSGGEGGGVLSRADGVVEGQRAGAGTAAIGRGAAVVERQRRGAAGNGDRLGQVHRQRDGLAGIEVAARRRLDQRRDGRRRGVDLRVPWVRPEIDEVGGVAGTVLHVAPLRLTVDTFRLGVF